MYAIVDSENVQIEKKREENKSFEQLANVYTQSDVKSSENNIECQTLANYIILAH